MCSLIVVLICCLLKKRFVYEKTNYGIIELLNPVRMGSMDNERTIISR